MLRNVYLVKNHKIANNSTTMKAREKIRTVFETGPAMLTYPGPSQLVVLT
jgi:hypothetical protein